VTPMLTALKMLLRTYISLIKSLNCKMRIKSVIVIFLVFGCTSGVSEENLNLLNGYWEIEEVIFPDGSKKDYNVNTNIDYIMLDDKKGYRKKLQPKFNGTFDTSDDADLFVIAESNNVFSIHYGSKNNDGLVAQRSEELVTLSENNFTVRSADGLTYSYRRFEPIKVEE